MVHVPGQNQVREARAATRACCRHLRLSNCRPEIESGRRPDARRALPCATPEQILLVARVHPETKGKDVSRAQYDEIWAASVRLMGRAFTLGSIVTVFPEEAAAVGRTRARGADSEARA